MNKTIVMVMTLVVLLVAMRLEEFIQTTNIIARQSHRDKTHRTTRSQTPEEGVDRHIVAHRSLPDFSIYDGIALSNPCPSGFKRFFRTLLCTPDDVYITGDCPTVHMDMEINIVAPCVIEKAHMRACPDEWLEIDHNTCVSYKANIVTYTPVEIPPPGYQRINRVLIKKITLDSKMPTRSAGREE